VITGERVLDVEASTGVMIFKPVQVITGDGVLDVETTTGVITCTVE